LVSRQDPGRTVPGNFSHQDLGNISGDSSGAEEKGGTGDWGFGYNNESEDSGKLSGASLLGGASLQLYRSQCMTQVCNHTACSRSQKNCEHLHAREDAMKTSTTKLLRWNLL